MDLQSFREVKKHFRILKHWRIRLKKSGPYQAQITCYAKDKIADLWDWPNDDLKYPRPNDFYFHECLHAALKELRTLRGITRYNAEEELIQDICYLIRLYAWDEKCEAGSFYKTRDDKRRKRSK